MKIIYDSWEDEFECPQCKHCQPFNKHCQPFGIGGDCYQGKDYFFKCVKCQFEMAVKREDVQWESSCD